MEFLYNHLQEITVRKSGDARAYTGYLCVGCCRDLAESHNVYLLLVEQTSNFFYHDCPEGYVDNAIEGVINFPLIYQDLLEHNNIQVEEIVNVSREVRFEGYHCMITSSLSNPEIREREMRFIVDSLNDASEAVVEPTNETRQTTSPTPSSTSLEQNPTSAPTQDVSESVVNNNWFINNNYRRDELYTGFRGYHAHQSVRYNAPISRDAENFMVGVELELYVNSDSAYNKFTDTPRNWYFTERDGSLGERSRGVEMISIPLKPSDASSAEFWKPSMDWLRENCSSKRCSSTGLHIHLSKSIMGTDSREVNFNIVKLLYFYKKFLYIRANNESAMSLAQKLNVRVFGRALAYSDAGSYDDVLADYILDNISENLPQNVQDKLTETLLIANSQSRYRDINTSTYRNLTIEFRKGKGIISESRIAGVISYCIAMCKYVKNKKVKDLNVNEFIEICKNTPAIMNIYNVRNIFITEEVDDER